MEDFSLPHLENVAIEAILCASDVLKRGFLSPLTTQAKSNQHDVVTQFDKEAERVIIDVIRSKFPKHNILGEESGIHDCDSHITWIIDPIDGTWNFSRKIPAFGCAIAVMYQREIVLGIVVNPISDEIFIGRKEKGATVNGRPIRVSDRASLDSSGVSIRFERLHDVSPIGVLRKSGSTVLDMSYVAKGSLEGFVDPAIRLWDFAAPMILIQESGGSVTDLCGQPLLLNPNAQQTYSILGTNGLIHQKLQEWIMPYVTKEHS